MTRLLNPAPAAEMRFKPASPFGSGTDAPRMLAIARIVKPQGRRGEVSAAIATDFPDRFQRLKRVYLEGPGQPCCPRVLEGSWLHKGRVVLKFAGIDSIDEAQSLRGYHVLIPFEERAPLPERSYYWPEIEGCRVVAGEPGAWTEIGTVVAVEPTPGVALLHVDRSVSGRSETLIPLAEEICKKIDPVARLIVIDPPEDLLDLNDGSLRSQKEKRKPSDF